MADLLIRNIEEQLKLQIEDGAREHRHSLSQEAKELLRLGLSARRRPKKLGTWLSRLVPREYRGDDLVFERHDPARWPPGFE